MLKLIFWPNPYLHESPASLFSRAAFHNGYPCANSFARALGHNSYISFRNLFKGQRLSNFFLLNPDNPFAHQDIFYHQTPQFQATRRVIISNITLPPHTCRFRHHFCPLCLKDGYWRFIQDLDLVEVCPYHHVNYLKNCPNCGKEYDWSKVDGPFCECKFDLRNATPCYSAETASSELLQLFITKNQDAVNRLFAAAECLKYKILSSSNVNDELTIATNIGVQNESAFYTYLEQLVRSCPALPKEIALTPWLLSRDQWIEQTTAKYMKNLPNNVHSCGESNCCGALAFTSRELQSILHTNAITTNHIGKKYNFKIIAIADRIFYQREKICEAFKSSFEERSRVPIPEEHIRSDFESLDQIQKNRGLSAKKTKQLITTGYLKGHIIHGKRYSILIHKIALEKFDQTYVADISLARKHVLNVIRLNKLLKNAGIFPSSGDANIATLPYVYRREHISNQVASLLDTEAKLPTSTKKNLKSAWYFAKLANLQQRTLKIILKNKILPELSNLYTTSTKTFKKPHSALQILMEWRNQYMTNSELATRLNINCSLLGKRFEHIETTKPIKIGVEKLYHMNACMEIERQLKSYVPIHKAKFYAHISSTTFRHLQDSQFIQPIKPGHSAYCPRMSLYDLSNILSKFSAI